MKKTRLALDELLNLMPDAIVVVDGRGRITFANDGVRALLGYSPGALVGRPVDCLVPKPLRRKHRAWVAAFRRDGKPMIMGDRPLVHGLDRDGRPVPMSISIANIELDGERYSIAVMRDAGELASEITQITVEAETDALTGLANRSGLAHALEVSIDKGRPFALLFLDLAKFKPFNDTYGHEVGDRVLEIVARRLQATVRTGDLAARIGGDEFVLMLDSLADDAALAARATRVADSIGRQMHIGDVVDAVGVNIGGALFPRDGGNGRELLKVADERMYRAKQCGAAYRGGD